VTPANLLGWLGTPYQFGWEMRRNFGRVFQYIDVALQKREKRPFELKTTALSRPAQLRLKNLTQQLSAQGHQPGWVQHLANLLANEADLNLARMRPYPLADTWQAARHEILEMFLSAAKLGLLNMRWDLMCPLCRGAKFTASALDGVVKGVHCPTCNIDFEADFSKNVELTFTPHPQIRPIFDNSYCIGGPMITPHILIHQIIESGETRTLSEIELPPGNLRFRTQNPGVEQWLEFDSKENESIDELLIQADTDTIEAFVQGNSWVAEAPERKVLLVSESSPPLMQHDSRKLILRLINRAPYPQRIYVERADWYSNAVTAAQVTTLQHFRDLFSDEVLRPGEEIGVQGMTILFSDLVGSTAMYNRWGDAASYALVREQFAFLQRVVRNHDGAIVKTIGDAIMGAFSDPADGVGAALAIQKEIHNFNAAHPNEPLVIKLGLHYGPCIAVNLNGRLDYFGTTVNLAARLEGQSRGGDIVLSEKLRDDPGVTNLLAELPVTVTGFATAIKGFNEDFRLYRIEYNKKTSRE